MAIILKKRRGSGRSTDTSDVCVLVVVVIIKEVLYSSGGRQLWRDSAALYHVVEEIMLQGRARKPRITFDCQ